jgi:non-ribosomal peptide synthase protein (TIGR01720 family)
VPIGKAIPNSRLYVLDSNLGLLPIGAIGELCVGGEGVGEGYLNDPAMTQSRFVDDPYAKKQGRLYRTGDLVRYQPDGNLEFIGRMDHQVKIRGYRIEPGEIEAAVEQHPAVKQCVVIVRDDARGQQRLVGYIVCESEQKPDILELRQFLRSKLPDYMVPAGFVTLDAMPLTPNGKIDRLALPPDMTEIVSSTPFTPPETPNEIALTAIMQEVLGRERIGIHDNFFELGGDSILAIQAISKANRAGLRLNPRQLFQFQTIAELAAVAGTCPVVQAEQGFVKGDVPLTPIQRHFFAETAVDIHHFNQSVLFEVQPLDARLLKRAVQKLVDHHDALRMRYRQGEGGWEQRNAGPDEVASKPAFVAIDLSSQPDSEITHRIEHTAQALQRSLDLEKGPIIRVAYFNLGPERQARLFIVLHHLVVDGLSWRILLEDLLAAYEQLSQGRSVELPPKTSSFQQWAHRLTEYSQSPEVANEKVYWHDSIPRSVDALPIDSPGGINTVGSVRTVTVSLGDDETQVLFQEALAAYHTQINELLLTALVKACAYWTGRKSLLLGVEGHGRESLFDDIDVSRTIGWFTTIYPIYLELPDSENDADALKSIKEQLRRVPNGGVGYGLLRPSLETQPRPQITFNYLGQFDQLLPQGAAVTMAQESTGSNQSPRASRIQVLDVTGAVTGRQLHITWSYSEALHRRTTIEVLASQFIAELRSLLEHCKSAEAGGYTPSDFPEASLSQEDLDGLLQELDESP